METPGNWHAFEEPCEEANRMANAVIGAAIEVHRHLGPGHKEVAYKAAMCHELELRGIPFRCEHPVVLTYKGRKVAEGQLDLVVADLVVIELKAVESITPVFISQTIAYLRLTNLRLGLIINFNVTTLKEGIKRVVLS